MGQESYAKQTIANFGMENRSQTDTPVKNFHRGMRTVKGSILKDTNLQWEVSYT